MKNAKPLKATPGRDATFGQDPMLNVRETADHAGIGTRTIWRMLSAGKFPAPDFRLGKRVVRWRASTVEGWLESNRPSGK
jgi:predicted DNA-binding transcriptional regulator AlpA